LQQGEYSDPLVMLLTITSRFHRILMDQRLKILGMEEDRDLSDLVNEAIGDLVGKHEKH
jgi:hypothetical protein